MGLRCKDWGDLSKAKVLLIGHDPRLQKSDTIAEHCFLQIIILSKLVKNKIKENKD